MKRFKATAAIILISTITASAAFVSPSDTQLEQAATTPSKITELLKDASPEQAAQVVKAVIVKIEAKYRRTKGAFVAGGAADTLIAAIVKHAFSSFSAVQAGSFAAALGTACGDSLAIGANAALVSAIQGALATAGGTGGNVPARAFANSFTAAAAPAGSVGVQGQNQNQAPPSIQPPVASPYPGQK